MRILFSALTPLSLTSFQSAIQLLAERGHELTIAVHEERESAWRDDLLEEIEATPNVTVEHVPRPVGDRWLALAAEIRSTRDLFQFFDPRFNDTYRGRATRRAPRHAVALAGTRLGRSAIGRRMGALATGLVERALPVSPEIVEYLRARRPDVVLFTPYLGLRTIQPDFLRAALSLGLRTGICVKSWDNLSSKSVIQPIPDRVFVWNEVQREEAVSLHGIAPERVAVTGAQCFDEWFSWRSRPREVFCARVGIDPARPYILYACSAPWTKQTEVEFVRRWVRGFRSSGDPLLARTAVVVRPHPKRPQEWPDVDISDLEHVVVFPRDPTAPTGQASKADYFDSIHHSAAVVGLNTSALIEAAIIGRPVLTLLDPEFERVQEGTLHFRYLLEVGGGVLRAARSPDEHARQLGEAVSGEDDGRTRGEPFVRAFIRPRGLEIAATPVFADEVEQLAAARPPARRRTPMPLLPLRALLAPLAARLDRASAPAAG